MRRSINGRHVTVIACVLLATVTAGCVRSSTYETVVKETEVTAAELQITRAEKEALAQQVRELEKLNEETITQIEGTLEAVQAVKRDAETQRGQAEANYGRLNQKIAQLVKRQEILRSELTVEKENIAGLKEQVNVFKKKVLEASSPGAVEIPISEIEQVTAPLNPLKVPVPEVLHDSTPPPAQQPAQAATPPSRKSVAEPVKSSEPTEAGWFSTITEWVLSVWRSLFS